LKTSIHEWMDALGATPEQMSAYLAAEEEALPKGTDPILVVDIPELERRVFLRHEAATAKAEAAELRAQLSKKQSRAAQSAKQSLSPSRRVADAGALTPLQQTERDLNLDPDWSNVTGFGHRT